jgi:uncharacterized phage-associated protein
MTKSKLNTVVNYFIYKNNKDKKGLSNKKLQKLLYYSQAWNLALKDEELFPEKFEAWIHGPAIPTVYLKFKDFGFNDISQEVDEKELTSLSDYDRELLDAIWDLYGKYDGDYLELLTHNEEPWLDARKDTPPFISSKNEISTKVMKEYYGKKLQKKGR